jgi:hypothetical protein
MTNTHALHRDQTHGLSVEAIKAYASDHAANETSCIMLIEIIVTLRTESLQGQRKLKGHVTWIRNDDVPYIHQQTKQELNSKFWWRNLIMNTRYNSITETTWHFWLWFYKLDSAGLVISVHYGEYAYTALHNSFLKKQNMWAWNDQHTQEMLALQNNSGAFSRIWPLVFVNGASHVRVVQGQ